MLYNTVSDYKSRQTLRNRQIANKIQSKLFDSLYRIYQQTVYQSKHINYTRKDYGRKSWHTN